ncbi:cytochrome c biogenesis protein ccsa [Phtheirospermum japonicum]|uniref:Cytochrome c biogenesis protein ccsa n=1 Tax=Phtheirospermum japonicum TaxID=374723 RepID=A0A830BYT3_9LAMI|nr:cytochrome c biogenesis protein ccsa [Phtheirospermum japonicum]
MSGVIFSNTSFSFSPRNYYRSQLIQQLDYWSYRVISLGFIFLTIGILSGAVWANEAWGSYWIGTQNKLGHIECTERANKVYLIRINIYSRKNVLVRC